MRHKCAAFLLILLAILQPIFSREQQDKSQRLFDDDKTLLKGYQGDDKTILKGYQGDDKTLLKGYQGDDKTLLKGYQGDDKTLLKGYQGDDKTLLKGYQGDDKTLLKGYPGVEDHNELPTISMNKVTDQNGEGASSTVDIRNGVQNELSEGEMMKNGSPDDKNKHKNPEQTYDDLDESEMQTGRKDNDQYGMEVKHQPKNSPWSRRRRRWARAVVRAVARVVRRRRRRRRRTRRRIIIINGEYGSWTSYGSCSKKCGGGTKTRIRQCNNPSPRHGGRHCSRLGAASQTISCNNHYCPVNGGYGSWTSYGSCSKKCGGGTKTRIRQCNNPSPRHGGRHCSRSGAASQTISCNNHYCPEPCKTHATTEGKCCVFPFIFRGDTYKECIIYGYLRAWCALTSNYDKDNKKWGYCKDIIIPIKK